MAKYRIGCLDPDGRVQSLELPYQGEDRPDMFAHKIPPKTDKDIDRFLANAYMTKADHAYLYQDGQWDMYTRKDMLNALARLGERIGVNISVVTKNYDTVCDVDDHEGTGDDIQGILLLRQATGYPGIDWERYMDVSEIFADLRRTCSGIVSGDSDVSDGESRLRRYIEFLMESDVRDVQDRYHSMVRSGFTKSGWVGLARPFRDRDGLSDLQASRIIRGEMPAGEVRETLNMGM